MCVCIFSFDWATYDSFFKLWFGNVFKGDARGMLIS